ncbi:hypothetical protein LUZ63_004102 [Rhynchospora breviuscula]|uniref:Dirigent protein n=1 Tax=Rhynchospora breviuscula TaxID=2022672 RepID=A0A9Q0I0V4_9POAL|nr:hypothetical protein LUZ63_004102 [Rhynchospora breviuscula]
MNKPTFVEDPARHPPQQNEFYLHLYLHHTPVGPNHNQSTIVRRAPRSFATTVINDWPLYDGLGPNAAVIARAQGLHAQAGMGAQSWHNTFSIVFTENTMFSGSSLQVMGPNVLEGEWAIVGGTGMFRLAQGVIYKKLQERRGHTEIMELDIHGFGNPMRAGSFWSLGKP